MTEESTTPDLAGVMRSLLETITMGDLGAAMSFFASGSVLELGPEAHETYEGRAAIRGYLEDWLGAYDEFRAEAEEMRDVGSGVRFVVVVMHGRPRGSTGWVQFRYGSVLTWIGGLIERTRTYFDIDEARADAERLAQERG
jgi:hypothetical protein